MDARPPGDAAPAPFAGLAGSWHGALDHPEHGRVTASVHIAGGGAVSWIVAARGHQLAGRAELVRWDGRALVVRLAGATHTVEAARMDEGTLVVELPGLGPARLSR